MVSYRQPGHLHALPDGRSQLQQPPCCWVPRAVLQPQLKPQGIEPARRAQNLNEVAECLKQRYSRSSDHELYCGLCNKCSDPECGRHDVKQAVGVVRVHPVPAVGQQVHLVAQRSDALLVIASPPAATHQQSISTSKAPGVVGP